MKVTQHANSIDYELRSSPTSAFSGVIQWDAGNVPEMIFMDDGVLPINGPTRIFTFRERAPDGETLKAWQLCVSDESEIDELAFLTP
jgi:hypothetical protein